jgi:mercuric ion binding protein
MMNKTTLTLLGSLSASALFAAEQTIDLSVPTMNCPVCPITVRKALEKVPGVSNVAVDFAFRCATVAFEDTVATSAQLTRATAEAGYPSALNGDPR